MPTLLGAAERGALERSERGATQARMLRELAEAIELLTAERPLVLVLEDLHWSDASTLAWLGYVARRREAARLLVLGTYRPVEAIVAAHPLRALTEELRRQEQCKELPLDYLSETAVADYLTRQCPGHELPAGIARMIHQRTDGNPLFVVTLVDTLVRQGVLEPSSTGWGVPRGLEAVGEGVPESLRQLIEQQLEQVSPEDQAILEAASVAGVEFSAAAAAAGVERATEVVDARCTALARRGQFIGARGAAPWPDGTVAARYGFIHALYPEVLYHRVPAGQRVRLHHQIGGRLEAGYGGQAREIAAELAVHFVRARDDARAVQYLRYAGENAWQRSAYQEAITHLTKGLELLPNLPDTAERTQQELDLQMILGPATVATKGYAAPEVERAYARARELCQQVANTPQRFLVLRGLQLFYLGAGKLRTARELGEHLLELVQDQDDPALQVAAHFVLGQTFYYLGEPSSALKHMEQGQALDDAPARLPENWPGAHPGVQCRLHGAWALWQLGYPNQALRLSREGLTRAQDLSHPLSSAFTHLQAAILHQHRRDPQRALEQAESARTLVTEHGLALALEAAGMSLRGWALAGQGREEEGIAQMRKGLAAWQASGTQSAFPYYAALLADGCRKTGHIEEGIRLVTEALRLANKNGDRYWEAEVHRLKGELTLQSGVRSSESGAQSEAEDCFRRALDVARHQQAKSPELRAAMSLSRLWQRQGKREEARKLLGEIHSWFSEGFDTADLKEAKALLEELRG
jgi:predicted ATPase